MPGERKAMDRNLEWEVGKEILEAIGFTNVRLSTHRQDTEQATDLIGSYKGNDDLKIAVRVRERWNYDNRLYTAYCKQMTIRRKSRHGNPTEWDKLFDGAASVTPDFYLYAWAEGDKWRNCPWVLVSVKGLKCAYAKGLFNMKAYADGFDNYDLKTSGTALKLPALIARLAKDEVKLVLYSSEGHPAIPQDVGDAYKGSVYHPPPKVKSPRRIYPAIGEYTGQSII